MLGASATTYRRQMMFSGDPGAVAAQFIFAVVDAFALTVLVFLRKGFGERFYTVFKFGMGLSILAFLIALRSLAGALLGALPMVMGMFGVPPLIGMLAGPMLSPPHHAEPHALFDAASLLYWAFLLVGFGQLVIVWLRSWNIGHWAPVHSKSAGEPLLTFGGRVNHWLAIIILEPLAVLLLGQILQACDPSVPFTYFVVLALFIAASATHQYRLYRDDLLDEQDARLLAGFYSETAKRVAAGGKATSKLGGFFFPLLLPKKPEAQVDMLRQWAKRHHEAAAGDEPPPPAPPPASAA
jgi:hypothetical protein